MLQVAPALRERYFGKDLELQNHSNYCPAWEVDAVDPTAAPGGDGESVAAVAARLRQLLEVGCLCRVQGAASFTPASRLLRQLLSPLPICKEGQWGAEKPFDTVPGALTRRCRFAVPSHGRSWRPRIRGATSCWSRMATRSASSALWLRTHRWGSTASMGWAWQS